MRRRALSVGVCLAAVGWSSAASAQVTPQSMMRGRQAREMEIDLIAKTEYDTNVARVRPALARLRGLIPADTIYNPGVNLNLVQPIGRQTIFLKGTASYYFHDHNERLDHSRIQGAGGFGGVVGPCSAVLGGDYSRARSELDDTVLVDTVENLLTVKRVNFGVACVRPPGIQLTLQASRDLGNNNLATKRMSDYETVSANAGLGYSRPATGSIQLQGQFARTEYPKRPTANGQVGGYELTGVGVQLERKLGARLEATGSATYVNVRQLAPPLLPPGATVSSKTSFSGLTYSVGLSFRASSRLRTSANFERKIMPTLIDNQSFQVETNYDLRTTYRLGTRITLETAATQNDIDSRGVAMPILTLTDARNRILLARASYRQSERLSLSLRGQREKRTSDMAQMNYISNRVSLVADVSF